MPEKICILTSVHPVFDVRIFYKEAKSLLRAGYEVVIIAQHDKEEIVDNIKIVPLPIPKNRLHRMTKIVWKLFKLSLKEKADIYHFHDPELIPIGLLLKLKGAKIVYDVHEEYPKDILYKDWIKNKYIKLSIAFLYIIMEKMGTFLFNKIIVATPKIAKIFPQSKVVLLRNMPILELIDSVKKVNIKKKKSVIIYAGGISKLRGIKEIIRAMEHIGDRAELWVLGRWESEILKKECENLKGWKYTKYLGFKSLEEVYSILKISDIGILFAYPIEGDIEGMPIKLFEYMACSIPMVVSNFDYWQKLFGECALFADPYNPKDIANKILYLLDNSNKAKSLGEKGRKLIEKKYNWESERVKLLNIYTNI